MRIDYEFVFFDVFFADFYIKSSFPQNLASVRHQEFVGNGQHDAQELLTILLDAIHEVNQIERRSFFCFGNKDSFYFVSQDLNRIKNKPQVPPVEDQGRSDNVRIGNECD